MIFSPFSLTKNAAAYAFVEKLNDVDVISSVKLPNGGGNNTRKTGGKNDSNGRKR
jgi:hypothetical protein